MPVITKYRVLPFLIIITISIACKKEITKISKAESESKRDKNVAQIESFKITIASGGGFTGLYKGYTLHNEGQVMRWRRFGAGQDSVLWTTQGDPEQIHNFKKKLEESGALRQTFLETSNMTTTVTLALPDTSYTWSWPGTGVNDKTPDVFKELYPLIEKYCINLNK